MNIVWLCRELVFKVIRLDFIRLDSVELGHKVTFALQPFLDLLCTPMLSLFSRNESRLIKSPVLSVCPPLMTLNRLVDFHGIWHRGNAIQGDLDAVIFNPISLITLKLLRLKILR
jgi:hypothetical protein